MKWILLCSIVFITSLGYSQDGFLGKIQMEGKPERMITIYDLMEIHVRIPEINNLGLALVDLIDLPSALIDSAKIGKIAAYDMGLYYIPEGYGFKLNSKKLNPSALNKISSMEGDESELGDIYLIGIENDGKDFKYLHIFVRVRGDVMKSIEEKTQISDKVISFRFEELPLFFLR